MATKAGIRIRREKVYQLVLKGANQQEISEKLIVTGKTINTDVKAIKKELASKLDKCAENIYVEFAERMKMRVRRYWNIIAEKESPLKERMRALENLRAEDVEAVKRAQIIGLLPKMLPGEMGEGTSQINNQQVNVFQILMNIKDKEKKEVIDVKDVQK